jgi:hypothetical protein
LRLVAVRDDCRRASDLAQPFDDLLGYCGRRVALEKNKRTI